MGGYELDHVSQVLEEQGGVNAWEENNQQSSEDIGVGGKKFINDEKED